MKRERERERERVGGTFCEEEGKRKEKTHTNKPTDANVEYTFPRRECVWGGVECGGSDRQTRTYRGLPDHPPLLAIVHRKRSHCFFDGSFNDVQGRVERAHGSIRCNSLTVLCSHYSGKRREKRGLVMDCTLHTCWFQPSKCKIQ
jgi:hypothetical protein